MGLTTITKRPERKRMVKKTKSEKRCNRSTEVGRKI